MSKEYPIEEEFEETLKRNMFLSLKNAELQNKIDKAIEYIKEIVQEDEKRIERKHTIEELKEVNRLLEILGDKENGQE